MDLDDDDNTPVATWSRMTDETALAIPFVDEDDDTSLKQDRFDMGDQFNAKTCPITQEIGTVKKVRRTKKRSPNRDDSDSDEDDDSNKNLKPPDESEEELPDYTDENYTPFNDQESISSGFKVGFAEDRNKKYRRTMEVSFFFKKLC